MFTQIWIVQQTIRTKFKWICFMLWDMCTFRSWFNPWTFPIRLDQVVVRATAASLVDLLEVVIMLQWNSTSTVQANACFEKNFRTSESRAVMWQATRVLLFLPRNLWILISFTSDFTPLDGITDLWRCTKPNANCVRANPELSSYETAQIQSICSHWVWRLTAARLQYGSSFRTACSAWRATRQAQCAPRPPHASSNSFRTTSRSRSPKPANHNNSHNSRHPPRSSCCSRPRDAWTLRSGWSAGWPNNRRVWCIWRASRSTDEACCAKPTICYSCRQKPKSICASIPTPSNC